MAIQDCLRSYDKRVEQDVVRQLARKMNIKIIAGIVLADGSCGDCSSVKS